MVGFWREGGLATEKYAVHPIIQIGIAKHGEAKKKGFCFFKLVAELGRISHCHCLPGLC